MLEQLLRLQGEGKWLEMRALVPAVFEGLAGSDLMKAYALASHAYANTAVNPAEWELARTYTVECARLADKNGPTHLWTLVQMSVILSNVARPSKADTYARAFLLASPNVKSVAHLRPWAFGARGFSLYLSGNFEQAAAYFGQASSGFNQTGNEFESVRASTKSAWAFGRAGLVSRAWSVIPQGASGDNLALWHGARALLLAKERRWSEAMEEAKVALSSPRHASDYIDAAEVVLVMAECASHLGGRARRGNMTHEASQLAARQACNIETILTLNLRGVGGDTPYETETRGSSDPHDSASLTSGVG